MNEDIDDIVARLRSAPQARVSSDFTARVMGEIARQRRESLFATRSIWFAAAAAVVVFLGIAFVRLGGETYESAAYAVSIQRADGTFGGGTAAPYVQAYGTAALAVSRDPAKREALVAAVNVIVRMQNAEGGWQNASQSAHNVAALAAAKAAGVAEADVPLKRGLRFLRANGIPETSEGELLAKVDQVLASI